MKTALSSIDLLPLYILLLTSGIQLDRWKSDNRSQIFLGYPFDIVVNWLSLVVDEDQFLSSLAFEQSVECLLVVKLEVGKDGSKTNHGDLLRALLPLFEFIEGVGSPSRWVGIYSLMIFSNVDIVMSPFLPAFHMPIIVIGNIALPPASSECAQVEVVDIVFLGKGLSAIRFLAVGTNEELSELTGLRPGCAVDLFGQTGSTFELLGVPEQMMKQIRLDIYFFSGGQQVPAVNSEVVAFELLQLLFVWVPEQQFEQTIMLFLKAQRQLLRDQSPELGTKFYGKTYFYKKVIPCQLHGQFFHRIKSNNHTSYAKDYIELLQTAMGEQFIHDELVDGRLERECIASRRKLVWRLDNILDIN